MTHSITKLQRWLDLIAFLAGRKYPVAVEDVMERVPAYAARWVDGDETARATARRTFERDKDELRALGIPIETVTYNVNFGLERVEGYVLRRRDFYLPYLKLVSGAAGGGRALRDFTPTPAGSAADEEPAAPTPPPSPAEAEEEEEDEPGRPGSARRWAFDYPARIQPIPVPDPPRPYRLDEVELTEEDAADAFDALREAAGLPSFPFAREARSAYRKLAFDLDPDAFPSTTVLHVDRPGSEEVLERLRPLTDSLRARKTVRFRYHGIYRDAVTDRTVRPYGLAFQHGHWYLVGYDEAREAVRVFRVGRMEAVEPNRRSPREPDYEIPADFRLGDHLRRDAWELGQEEPLAARVVFRFPLSLWAERNRYGRLVEERPDGSSVRAFDVQQVNPFLRWVLGLVGEAEIVSPPELAAELRRMAAEVSALHGEAE